MLKSKTDNYKLKRVSLWTLVFGQNGTMLNLHGWCEFNFRRFASSGLSTSSLLVRYFLFILDLLSLYTSLLWCLSLNFFCLSAVVFAMLRQYVNLKTLQCYIEMYQIIVVFCSIRFNLVCIFSKQTV